MKVWSEVLSKVLKLARPRIVLETQRALVAGADPNALVLFCGDYLGWGALARAAHDYDPAVANVVGDARSWGGEIFGAVAVCPRVADELASRVYLALRGAQPSSRYRLPASSLGGADCAESYAPCVVVAGGGMCLARVVLAPEPRARVAAELCPLSDAPEVRS